MLDNGEAILETNTHEVTYRPNYEVYDTFFQTIAKQPHQSCLLFTSRQLPTIDSLPRVKSFPLKGCSDEDAHKILKAKELKGKPQDYTSLIDSYKGHPQALEIVSSHIQITYDGNISQFLNQPELSLSFGNIEKLLSEIFAPLSNLEKAIMYWLAINREPVSLAQLQKYLLSSTDRNDVKNVLESLGRRSLIEKSQESASYTLQNVILEHLTDQFVEQIVQEITTLQLKLFHSHAIIIAQAKNYIRLRQIRLILQPILEKLKEKFPIQETLEQHLRTIVSQLQKTFNSGYGAGNAINLLVHLGCNLAGSNFQNLTIRQAYLENINLQGVDFGNSAIHNTVFSDVFGSVLTVSLSPEGNLLATGDTNGEIRIYQVQTGALLINKPAHSGWVRALTWSNHGTKLASASTDYTVKLWKLNSDVPQLEHVHTMTGHKNWIWSIAFSFDDTKLASGSDDTTMKVWEVVNGNCLGTYSHQLWVRFVSFRPDGLLVSASTDQVVKTWDIEKGHCVNQWQEETHEVRAVALTQDGKYVITGGEDCKVRLLELENKGKIVKEFVGHTARVWSVSSAQSQPILASSSADQVIKLWHLETGACLNTFTKEEVGRVRALAFSNDGKILATGSDAQGVKLWDVQKGECLQVFEARTSRIWSVAFVPNQSQFVSGGDDNILRLWDVQGNLIRSFSGHKGRIRSLAVSPQGDILASASNDRTIKLWHLETGKCLRTLEGHQDWVWSVIFSPCGKKLITTGDDQKVKIWKLSGKCLRTLELREIWCWAMALHPEGNILAIANENANICLWNLETQEPEPVQTLAGHENRVQTIRFSPDGKLLLSGSHDRTLKVWDWQQGSLIHTQTSHIEQIRAVAFSPDGKVFASADDEGRINIWGCYTYQKLYDLEGHEQLVWSLAFSSDGKLLVSGSENETMRLWTVADGECRKILKTKPLYEGMNISSVQGLTSAQKNILLRLGAQDFVQEMTH